MTGPYHVVWKRSALEVQLAAIVTGLLEWGVPAESVTRAMERLDRVLASDPNGAGESRPNFERIHSEHPLTVWYTVHDDERMVYVLTVIYSLPRRLR